MDIQIITREGEPEYAVVPWAQYQALLKAAGIDQQPSRVAPGVTRQHQTRFFRVWINYLVARRGKGIAIEALARTVGISPSYLALIESGERQPDAAIRRSLAWELTVPGGGMNRERTHQSSTLGWVAGRAGSGAPPASSADLPRVAGASAIADAGHADPDRGP